jgi:hypothetical protein
MVAKNRTRPSLTDRYLGAGAATLALVGIMEKAVAESPKVYGDLAKKLASKNCDVVAAYRAFLARRRQKTGTSPSSDVFELFIDDISPSPENDQIYRPIDPADPEVIELSKSIRAHGLREPIVVTVDGWILSGHRRYCASKLAGLTKVPCRIEPLNREADRDEFVRLLREYNRQRDKTADEKLREELVSINPTDAYQSLLDYREANAQVELPAMKIVGRKIRCRITDAKQPFLDAILAVLNDRRQYWPLSDRQIHYALLNNPPLKHASKPESIYRNDVKSYKSLTELLTRARLAGRISMQAIADETRPVITWKVHRNTRGYIRQELDGFLKGYWRDLMQSQPNHIEILGEKNTLLSMLKPVAMKYCIPLTVGRGFASLPPRYEMAQRYRKSGKQNLVLLIVSDFDPDGEEIAHSFARSMRDDFRIYGIHAVKVALTSEQVADYGLPPNMLAKETSSNYAKFVKKYGENVFEVEALDPEQLQDALQTAIDSVIDVDSFNSELEREEQDAAFLEATRHRVRDSLKGIDFGSDGEP